MTRETNPSNKRDIEDLKRVIAGLLETEGRTEAEVEAFRKKAAKMMHNLGLTENEVRAKDPDMFRSETTITRFDWVVSPFVLGLLEELTGTQCWYTILCTSTGKRSDRKNIRFAGYRSDVDQATWLYGHILAEAKKGCSGIPGTQERNSYLVGFGATVASKLRDLVASLAEVREEANTSGSGTDLVLLEKAQVVKAFLETIAPGLKLDSTRGTRVKNGTAFRAGARDGKNASLGRGVAQGAKALAHQGYPGRSRPGPKDSTTENNPRAT